MISSTIKNYASSFGWFYSALFYANTLVPAVGALIIWKFGFSGVFFASLALQFLFAVFFFIRFKNQKPDFLDKFFDLAKLRRNYADVFDKLKESRALPFSAKINIKKDGFLKKKN